MNKLYALYKKYKIKYLDKLLHGLSCFALVHIFDNFMPVESAFVLVLGIGLIIELLDKKYGGSCDAKDVVADIIGAAIALIF